MTIYKNSIINAMNRLAGESNTLFIGQGVEYSGSPMYDSIKHLPSGKRLEMPVAEDMQMGISIGLSLQGYLPISLYPRMDFLICAMSQLVNHLDKIGSMSVGRFNPKVIIRTSIGSKIPLDPGEQHCQDYTEMLKAVLRNINIYTLYNSEEIYPSYVAALCSERSSILIEFAKYMR